MNRSFRTTLVWKTLLFGGALLVGWIGQQIRQEVTPSPSKESPKPTPPQLEPFPEEQHRFTVDDWLASALVDADAARIRQISEILSTKNALGEKAWRIIASRWLTLEPGAALAFAQYDDKLRLITLEEWAALDPSSAHAKVSSPSNTEWIALIEGAARKDVSLAFQFLQQSLDAGMSVDFDAPWVHGCGLEPSHFAELARRNPQLSIQWAERFPRSDLLGATLAGWHEESPEDALTWLDSRSDRNAILFDLANYMSETSMSYRPALADLLAHSLPAGNDRIEAFRQMMESLARDDLEQANKETARLLPDPESRAEVIGEIAIIAARKDSSRAWEILDQLDPSIQNIARVQLPATEIIDEDRSRRVNTSGYYESKLTAWRGLQSPAEVRSMLLDNLIQVDKEQAILAMNRIPIKDLSEAAGSAFYNWQSRDPESAILWLAKKFENQGTLQDVGYMIDLHGRDRSHLDALIQILPIGTVRNTLIKHVANDLAESDPHAALRFAKELSSAPEVVESVYHAWAAKDARAAIQQLATDTDAPASAWNEVAEKALQDAPEEFSRLVANLPDETTRDAAAAKIVKIASLYDDPLPAADWALTIGEESKRQEALEEVIQRIAADLRLARNENTAASLRDLISTSAILPEAEKARWLERIALEIASP